MCIFAYGQTGSGKTHTMAGSNVEDCDGRGINYRALDDLFSINEQRRGEVMSWLRLDGRTCKCCCCEQVSAGRFSDFPGCTIHPGRTAHLYALAGRP